MIMKIVKDVNIANIKMIILKVKIENKVPFKSF